jgi:hypothetical protein
VGARLFESRHLTFEKFGSREVTGPFHEATTQEGSRGLQIHEPDPILISREYGRPMGLLDERRSKNNIFILTDPLGKCGPQSLEPRSPILISQRHPPCHFGDVFIGVKGIGVVEVPV